MKTMNKLFIISATLILMLLGAQAPKAYAIFDNTNALFNVSGIMIGDFTLPVLEWNPDTDYQIGDRFTYNGLLWEVRADGDYSQPPEGAVLTPFGIYQEITDEYRDYNTYFEGDIVIFNGIEYQALHGGLSGQTPGTVAGWQAINTTEWQEFNVYNEGDIVTYNGLEYVRLYDGSTGDEPGTAVGWNVINSDDWYLYNVYNEGDTVVYNGNTYEANYYTQGNIPEGNNVGEFAQWRLVQAVIEPGQTTHEFDDSVLNATITLDGVVIVENGVINAANASSIDITVSKQPQGSTYWQFQRNGSLRIRSNNGTFQYQQNFTFDSLIIDLP